MTTTRIFAALVAAVALSLPALALPAAGAQGEPVALLATGDTEGHVSPCRTCSEREGLGGLARRATLVERLRADGPTLLVDAGNALHGAESFMSQGAVVAAAYDALGYDAVNLGYRDFRLGLRATLDALQAANVPSISANLHRAGDGERLFPPFIVRERGGTRWAIVGVTEAPALLDGLPHLRRQLEGLDVRDPRAALAAVLPEARAASDAVLLLHYGSAAGLRTLLEGSDLTGVRAVVAAGDSLASSTPPSWPEGWPRVAWTHEHGTRLTRLALDGTRGVEQLDVSSELAPSAEVEELLAPLLRPAAPAAAPAFAERVHERLPAPEARELGTTYLMHAEGANRALRLHVDGVTWLADEGGERLVLDATFENQVPFDVVLELDEPEATRVASLERQLYLVVDGREVRRVAPLRALPGQLPDAFTLSQVGSAASGKVAFEAPPGDARSLSLRYYHDPYGSIAVELGDAGVEPEAATEVRSNDVVELGVYGVESRGELGGRSAPPATRWLVVDLRGRSLITREVPALVLDEDAAPAEQSDVGEVFEYLLAEDLLQVLVDGEYGYTMDADASRVGGAPPFLPDATAGGRAAFLVPETARSVELVCCFPEFRLTTGERIGQPETLRFLLEGTPATVPTREAIAAIDDGPLRLSFTGHRASAEVGDLGAASGERIALVDVTVENGAEEGGMFGVAGRLTYEAAGSSAKPRAVLLPGGVEARDPAWLPGGGSRSFVVAFVVPEAAGPARLGYSGVETATAVDLGGGAPVVGEGPAPPVAASGPEPPTDEARASGPAPAAPLPPFEAGTLAEGAPPADELLELGALGASAESDAVRLTLVSAELVEELDGRKPGADEEFLVLTARLQNLLPPVKGDDGVRAVPDLKLDLRSDLHFVANAREHLAIQRLGPDAIPRYAVVPGGDAVEGGLQGTLTYRVPRGALRFFSLQLLDPMQGNVEVVVGAPERGPRPVVPPASNDVGELGVWGITAADGASGPANTRLALDVRGRSKRTADPADHGGRSEPIPHAPAEWKPGRLHLLVDGSLAVHVRSERMAQPWLWLPGDWVGGVLDFDVPTALLGSGRRLELVLDLGEVARPGAPVGRPAPLVVLLESGPARTPDDGALCWSIDDGDLAVSAYVPESDATNAPRIVLRNERPTGAWFDVDEALGVVAEDGSVTPPDRRRYREMSLPPPSSGELWVPPGGVRAIDVPLGAMEPPPLVRYAGLLRFVDAPLRPGARPSEPPMPSIDGAPALDPSREARGIAGVGLDPARVNRAIDLGRDWLLEALAEDVRYNRELGVQRDHELIALALLHADAHALYPEFDEQLREYLDRVRPLGITPSSTYRSGLLAMVVERYGDPRYRTLLEDIARYLVEDQGPDGSWNYVSSTPERHFVLSPEVEQEQAPNDRGGPLTVTGEAPDAPLAEHVTDRAAPMRRLVPWEVNGDGDNSVTQYAALGLHACAQGGVPIDAEVWRRLLAVTWARQTDDGGWGYVGGRSYGSMTCAGASIAAIAMHALEPERAATLDHRVRRGVRWLAANWRVGLNPLVNQEEQQYAFYHAYGVERVGQLLGADFMGTHEWYPEFAKWLVEQQKGDGSWPPGQSETPRLATAYALLILTRATETLDPVKRAEARAARDAARPRTGTLSMSAEAPEARAVVVILDGSGSMLEPPAAAGDGERATKFDLARAAVAGVAEASPEGSLLGLVVYGHRKRAREEGADEDVELVVPVGPLDRSAFMSRLEELRARGRTPLALSLDEAVRALREAGVRDGTVVLLTDGGQVREPGDPVDSAKRVTAAGYELEIVGFDVEGANSRAPVAWREQLASMAEASGARYAAAGSGVEVARAVLAAGSSAPGPFEVVDASGAAAASGPFGGAVELEPGDYLFRTSFAGRPFETPVKISRGRTTRVTFDAAGARE